jgi:dihydropteroate synthase
MGILNVTPDSFSDGGKFMSQEGYLKHAERMIAEGADLLDIGGYSTRPGAVEITPEEELHRVIPVIQDLTKKFPHIPLSIDTFRAVVAREAVKNGARLVNDVSGGQLDAEMFATVARLGVPYILMHMKGTPATMKMETHYDNILLNMWEYFRDRTWQARQAGIKELIIDPGFGFAKTIDQNYYILENLAYFHSLNLPLLVGLSRKSMVYKRLNTEPSEAINGSTVLHTLALNKGVEILRVHDVKEAREAVALVNFTKKQG